MQFIPTGLRYRNAASLVAAFILTLATASCRGSGRPEGDVVVVNAPVAGEVRRVLVSEGAEVSGGATIIEIAVQESLPPQPHLLQESQVSQASQESHASLLSQVEHWWHAPRSAAGRQSRRAGQRWA